MSDRKVFFNERYLELTMILAKRAGQYDLYLRISRLLRNLDIDLVVLNDAINLQMENTDQHIRYVFPEFEEWNRMETELLKNGLWPKKDA